MLNLMALTCKTRYSFICSSIVRRSPIFGTSEAVITTHLLIIALDLIEVIAVSMLRIEFHLV